MFGMLDYRAHKLLLLLYFPIRLCIWVTYFANIAASVFFANLTGYSLLLKILIGYAIFEGIGMILLALWTFIFWVLRGIFFWVIDVVPSQGDNVEEARAVALSGPIFRLSKKVTTDIGNMTLEEAIEFSKRANGFWGKVIFKAHDRVGKRLLILYQHHAATGKQPIDLKPQELKELVGHLEFSTFERLVVSPAFLRSALAFFLIVISLSLMSS